MRSNCNMLEGFLQSHILPNPVIEIVSNDDPNAENMKEFANSVADNIIKEFPDLKVYGVSFTKDPHNCEHPFLWGLWKGYQIHIDKNYDLKKIKRRCMDLEIDSNGERCCDIDVYRGCFNKISRIDLGYSKK